MLLSGPSLCHLTPACSLGQPFVLLINSQQLPLCTCRHSLITAQIVRGAYAVLKVTHTLEFSSQLLCPRVQRSGQKQLICHVICCLMFSCHCDKCHYAQVQNNLSHKLGSMLSSPLTKIAMQHQLEVGYIHMNLLQLRPLRETNCFSTVVKQCCLTVIIQHLSMTVQSARL